MTKHPTVHPLAFDKGGDDYHVLRLLGNEQISAGKAAELLRAIQAGDSPVLPPFEAPPPAPPAPDADFYALHLRMSQAITAALGHLRANNLNGAADNVVGFLGTNEKVASAVERDLANQVLNRVMGSSAP